MIVIMRITLERKKERKKITFGIRIVSEIKATECVVFTY